MMQRRVVLNVLFLCCFSLFLKAQRDIKVYNEDFDGNGVKEELIINSYLGQIDKAVINYDGGLKTCTLQIMSKSKQPSLLNVVPMCDNLLQNDYKPLIQGIDSFLFQLLPVNKSLDPTMGWLLDAYSSKKLLDDHPYFASWARFKPKVVKTYYESPKPHRMLVKGKLVKTICKMHEKADTTYKSWITLDANRLDEARQLSKFDLDPEWPQLIDTIGNINVFKTGHSIYLETDTAHQIIFVSDGVLFGNMQKLEWESIQQVEKYGKYFLILTHPYPAIENKMFLVDSKKGVVLEFRKDVLLDYENHYYNIESFEVMEDGLYLFIRESPQFPEIKEKTISLLKVKASLELIGK